MEDAALSEIRNLIERMREYAKQNAPIVITGNGEELTYLDSFVWRAADILEGMIEPGAAGWTGFELHLAQQREFSLKTFGPGTRTAGVIDHIRRELNEIEADPSDIEEWIDVVILGLDGAWRAGYEPHEIITALREKQARNQAREWPDWRTADPDRAIEHVREEEDQNDTAGDDRGVAEGL